MTHAFPPGCERQPKWLRQKAMVMTYARCSYLPTDIFSSILARFPQSGYERMRPQSQFVLSAGCSNNPQQPELMPMRLPFPWECNDCRNPTSSYIGFLNVGFGIPFPAAALVAQTYTLRLACNCDQHVQALQSGSLFRDVAAMYSNF